VLTTTQSNNVYVNCAASCWGTPSNFLTKLATSNFIHVTDQYVAAPATIATRWAPQPQSHGPPRETELVQYLQLVHTAARAHGSGYGHVYHVFLRSGVDVCTSANVCYSPNNSATFVFCAYHGAADFQDIGHVLYSVEPYQNVPGCSVAQPSPNGAVVDSTSSTLSHELIETITDPDGTAWFARGSLPEYGAEIGDICEKPLRQLCCFLNLQQVVCDSTRVFQSLPRLRHNAVNHENGLLKLQACRNGKPAFVESRFCFLTEINIVSYCHRGSSADYPKFIPGRSRRVQHIANLGVALFSGRKIERNRSLVHQQSGMSGPTYVVSYWMLL